MSRGLLIQGLKLYFLPVKTRIPLKFGAETLNEVICARVEIKVRDPKGRTFSGWGETPLSVQWVWPSDLSYQYREQELREFCVRIAQEIRSTGPVLDPIAWGVAVQGELLPQLLKECNESSEHEMPHLAALVCLSLFDIAIHDCWGLYHDAPIYSLYGSDMLSKDLSSYLQAEEDLGLSFKGLYPQDFLLPRGDRDSRVPAWHLVGGKDLISPGEGSDTGPDDGYPLLLRDWIRRDGLFCLKVKLSGTDSEGDYRRLTEVGEVAIQEGVLWLTADFNCQVKDPGYVNEILDKLLMDHPHLYGMILYVEQPFPYELEEHAIDVRSVSARKPLFMDESAHTWELVKLGRRLGWTGVALKTCKTQTGALLSLCWAKAHGMTLMVQDLTNPMLAQIPHIQLGYHAGTIMGVETNSMQFYPDASMEEARIHPGLFSRRNGRIDASSVLSAPGFGYRVEEIGRRLPEAAFHEE